MTIEVRREWVWWLAVGVVVAALFLLGQHVSPRAEDGRPVLLLPAVRRVEFYRSQAARWVDGWASLDANLQAALASAHTRLLDQSQAAQRDLDAALRLSDAVAATEPPPTLIGLHDQTRAAAETFVAATLALNRWLSAPSAENRTALETACAQATATVAVLKANTWITGSH